MVSLTTLAATRPLIVGPTLFTALVWFTVALVVQVFLFVLYGVVRAGGVDLGGGH